jgi:hypothetical protein
MDSVASKVETDPLGTVVDYSNSYMSGGGSGPTQIGFYGTPQMPNMGCSVQGVPTPCGMAAHMVNVGMYDRSQVVFGDPAANGSLSGTWGLQNINYTLGRRGNDNVGESRGRGYAFEHGYLWLADQTPGRDRRRGGRGAYVRVNVPLLGGNPTDLQRAIFDAAYREFKKRLGKGNCAKLFGGAEKGNQLLKGASFEVADLGKPQPVMFETDKYSVRNTGAEVAGNTVRLNSYGAFFVQGNSLVGPNGKTYNITESAQDGITPYDKGMVLFSRDVDVGAFMLLHELGHLAGVFGPDFFIVNGKKDEQKTLEAQTKHNSAVLRSCFNLSSQVPGVTRVR